MAKTGTVDRKTLDALLKSLLLLGRAIEQVMDTRAVVAACGSALSASKVRMLKLIAHSGKQSVGQVARFLGVSDPAASQLAEALVRQKLITRNTDPKDRRTAFLKLTASGKKLTQVIEQEQRHRLRLALRSAGPSRSREWGPFLGEMTMHLTEAEQSFDQSCLQCGSHEDQTCVLEGGAAKCLYRAHTARREQKEQEQKERARKSSARKTSARGTKAARRRARSS
ncbi:MAG: MarR family transcriptional regulator [Phycisphaerales bacterium]|nr:MAG: MarR family transcriptional regulator [Phycisphaerales bacterium]